MKKSLTYFSQMLVAICWDVVSALRKWPSSNSSNQRPNRQSPNYTTTIRSIIPHVEKAIWDCCKEIVHQILQPDKWPQGTTDIKTRASRKRRTISVDNGSVLNVQFCTFFKNGEQIKKPAVLPIFLIVNKNYLSICQDLLSIMSFCSSKIYLISISKMHLKNGRVLKQSNLCALTLCMRGFLWCKKIVKMHTFTLCKRACYNCKFKCQFQQ